MDLACISVLQVLDENLIKTLPNFEPRRAGYEPVYHEIKNT